MLQINKNTKSVTHNTSVRKDDIKYICIHYVGATGDAKSNVDYYSQPTVTNASADFFVGHNGDIWQYNQDPKARYTWAVGGNRRTGHGGLFYGRCKNANSVSIEMCVKTRSGKTNGVPANSPDWYITDETMAATVELTRYLMGLYNVPADRVIRHFDVTGKLCPGVVGWNSASGDESAWEMFKERIVATKEADEEMTGEEIYNKLNEYLASQSVPDWAQEELLDAVKLGITDGTNLMQMVPRYQAALMARRAVIASRGFRPS